MVYEPWTDGLDGRGGRRTSVVGVCDLCTVMRVIRCKRGENEKGGACVRRKGFWERGNKYGHVILGLLDLIIGLFIQPSCSSGEKTSVYTV
jgi:hypothetical protein